MRSVFKKERAGNEHESAESEQAKAGPEIVAHFGRCGNLCNKSGRIGTSPLQVAKATTHLMEDFKGSICCIGAGYVGGPTMAIMALKTGLRVTVCDMSQPVSIWLL